MRHATAPGETTAGQHKAKAFDGAEERDAYLESSYSYPEHDDWPSTLVFVWVHAEELRDAFLRWWELSPGGHDEQLRRWEVSRFGTQLEPAAHAIVRWRVIRTIDGIRKRGREPRVLYESLTERLTWEYAAEATKRIDGEGTLDYLARLVVAAAVQAEPPQARLPYPEEA